MDWFWRWLASWRAGGTSGVRRVIILEIAGLEPALVDYYMEQGLLHHLALLADIGTRVPLVDRPTGADGNSIRDAIQKAGLHAVVLPPVEPQLPADLAAICVADREQQERLFAALTRSRPAVVDCVFDMPTRLTQLIGPQPDEPERHVLRDVYARMDEIAGKAFSFVDEKSVLLAVIHGPSFGEVASTPAGATLLFSSRRLTDVTPSGITSDAVFAELMSCSTRRK